MASGSEARVAGIDLGKATVRVVVGRGAGEVEAVDVVAHEGRPLEIFCELHRKHRLGECAALAATGLYADDLAATFVQKLPDETCLEAALPRLVRGAGAVNVVDVGARGYAVLARAADGRITHLENDKCSSGTGETMIRLASRFGLSIEDADRLASAATRRIPITARCSVFAKSEMTHFGNQGQPADALFAGFFASVAAYVVALLARVRVPGPIHVVGGPSRIRALVAALGEAAGQDVIVPEHALYAEALGAMLLAAEQPQIALPADPQALLARRARGFRVLRAPSELRARTVRLEAPPIAADARRAPAVLGLDLGSTGSKAVLARLDDGEATLDVYDRTRGNPVVAAQQLVVELLKNGEIDVRAVGVTGSGREAVAQVLRATFPELCDRIVVENEIVAHATAAIRCDPDRGKSLSVVEIGGQDAKFIQIADGRIVESDLNKACSAGTGSFLEEQALLHGIEDVGAMTRLAMEATRPPDLGQMCTVFVAEAAAEARGEGFSLADLMGGFHYAVIHNYVHRVMGQRTFGARVFLQGKPATGPALAWTLAAVSGREVVVPPNPGAMGAWGIALRAREHLRPESLVDATAFPLAALLSAAVVERSDFQCKDKGCSTFCRIERTQVEVRGDRRTVFSGGACPKYEVAGGAREKLGTDAPSPFDERAALLARFLPTRANADARVLDVPAVGACVAILPWLTTFLSELGLGVEVRASSARSLPRGEELCYSFDACAPAKLAHGVLDVDGRSGDGREVFFPKVLSLPGGGLTCAMEQALPETIREALAARGRRVTIHHPPLSFGGSRLERAREIAQAARGLGVPIAHALRAALRADDAQRRFEEEREQIGAGALAWARRRGAPIVVLCGPAHVILDRATNADLPTALRDAGAIAIPMDCFPIPADVPALPRVAWADTNRALRIALGARAAGDVYPILLSSFGCGPSSFGETIFSAVCEGHPHTALESDGHGGTAGYVTRIQAFLHGVRAHDRRPSPISLERLELLLPLSQPPISVERGRRRLIVPALGDRISEVVAAGYRAAGLDAVAAGPASENALAIGRRDCSGKECLPYQMIWGAFREHLEREPPTRPTALVQVQGDGMCRNCMFSMKDTLSLERMGLAERVGMRHLETDPSMGRQAVARLFAGIAAWDLLYQLAGYHRPIERRAGDVDRLHRALCDRLIEEMGRPIARLDRRRARLADAARASRFLFDADGVGQVVVRAAHDYARFADANGRPRDLRTVLLSGDIYVRHDERSSDRLLTRLNERGLRVIPEPTSTFAEYLGAERMSEIIGLPKTRLENAIVRVGMARLRRMLSSSVRRLHPWLPDFEPAPIERASRRLLDRFPRGEAPVTVGSVLSHGVSDRFDGVVVASPWGCAPALVSEGLLRHVRDVPMLFVYCDGAPLPERRLDAFAFQLRRRPPRAAQATASSAGSTSVTVVSSPSAPTAQVGKSPPSISR